MRLQSPPAAVLALSALLSLGVMTPSRADPVRPPPAQGGVADRELAVLNRSHVPVEEIYVSPSDQDSWGEDRLGDATLSPGGSFRLRLARLRGCDVDVEVVFADATREEKHQVNACRARQVVFDGSGAVPVNPPVSHTVSLLNRGGRPIQEVFISPADASQWGDDRLTDETLSVGSEATLSFTGSCEADLRIVYDNRSAEERRGLDLCATPHLLIAPGWTTADAPPTVPAGSAVPSAAPPPGPSPSSPPAPDRTAAAQIEVANRTGHDIAELYLYPDGASSRGPDRLGADVIKDGATLPITFDRGGACSFTAALVFAGHLPNSVRPGLDLCADPNVTLTP